MHIIHKHITGQTDETINNQKTKPNKTYNKNEVNPYKDFKEFLELYKTIEHRNNFSEIRDHALWTAIECKNSKTVKQQIINAETEQQLTQILSKLKF